MSSPDDSHKLWSSVFRRTRDGMIWDSVSADIYMKSLHFVFAGVVTGALLVRIAVIGVVLRRIVWF